MAPTPATRTTENGDRDAVSHAIDPNAPAGAANSLGGESVRDGRPSTEDDVVEAIDEEGPGVAETD